MRASTGWLVSGSRWGAVARQLQVSLAGWLAAGWLAGWCQAAHKVAAVELEPLAVGLVRACAAAISEPRRGLRSRRSREREEAHMTSGSGRRCTACGFPKSAARAAASCSGRAARAQRSRCTAGRPRAPRSHSGSQAGGESHRPCTGTSSCRTGSVGSGKGRGTTGTSRPDLHSAVFQNV